ncbi:MAG: hypothetical protein ACT4QC_17530 [Planctomycetaceae bacterium]
MRNYAWRLDSLLRARGAALAPEDNRAIIVWLAAQVVLFGLAYGAVMGAFGGLTGERAWQVAYSAAKVPCLLLATFVISLPSFFVLNTLMGLRPDFGEVLRALLAAQAVLTVILASLAPFTALWYVSFADYNAATAFNGLMFALATFAAQFLLRRLYSRLIARNARHRALLRAWLVVYAFVGIQMAWLLRPFIGDPDQPVQFFRADAWGNAYVVVGNLLWGLITR